MDVEILENDGKKVKISLKNSSSKIASLLEAELLRNKDVSYAAFRQLHLLFNNFELVLKVERGEPMKVLNKAVEGVIANSNALKKEILAKIK